MICVFAPDAVDFTTNGLGPVDPHVCTVTETLNGEWELTLEHMIDDAGKWARLTERNIVLAPVPAAMTPAMIAPAVQATSVDVYRVQTDGRRLNMRAKPSMDGKIIRAYKPGTDVISLGVSGSWREVTAPDGARGYMWASNTVFVRTETTGAQGAATVVEAKQLRDQPFRIYRIVPEMDKVKVYARHIFYDLMDNMIQSYKPAATATGAQVLAGIAAGCLSPHDFSFASDMSSTAEDVAFENVNPVDAILGAGGLIEKYGGELARDWYDVHVVNRVGEDAGVQVREGKNLLGIPYDVDTTDVVTRIMPTGEDADGKILYLPELYVDSPNIGDSPKWIHLPVTEANEVTKGDDKKTKEQCYTEMRDAAAAEYEKGCDAPKITLNVDFINCADTEEYKQYAALQNIYIGDGVRVLARRVGIAVTMRLTQYTYDCLTRKYTAMTLGAVADTVEGNVISARQLPSGIVTGAKLAINSVGAGQIKDGAVSSLQIGLAAIQTAHIQQATIDALMASSITALTARIGEIIAGTITTDALYAALADIITLRFGQAVGGSVQTDELRALYADLLHGEIGTANIGFGQVKDLIAGTQIFTEGTGGKLFVTRLAVTDANMVHLTVGELVVKGEDGKFYAVTVAPDGTLSATEKPVTGDNISDSTIPGGKLIENTITAREINVASLFADEVLARTITTAMLAVGAVEAINIEAGAIETGHISAGAWNALMLDAQERITLAVGGVRVGGRNLLLRTSDWGYENGAFASWTTDGGSGWYAVIDGELTIDSQALAATAYHTVYQPVTLVSGEEYTLSADVTAYGTGRAQVFAYDTAGGTEAHALNAAGGEFYNAGRYEKTFTAAGTSYWICVRAYGPRGLHVSKMQLEKGNKATDWKAAPEDVTIALGSKLDASANASGVDTGESEVKVKITNSMIDFDVPGTEGDSHWDSAGFSAPNIVSPSVMRRYRGPATLTVNGSGAANGTSVFTSLYGAFAALSGMYLDYDILIVFAGNTTEPDRALLRGACGRGRVVLQGNNRTVTGCLDVIDVSVRLDIYDLSVKSGTPENGVLYAQNSGSVYMANGSLYSSTSAYSLVCHSVFNSMVHLYGMGLYAAYGNLANADLGGRILLSGCFGSSTYACNALNGGIVTLTGTRPGGSVVRQLGGILQDDSTGTSAGTTPSAPVTTLTVIVSASNSGCYNGGWITNTTLQIGLNANLTHYGAMWFPTSGISGTVYAAALRLYRGTGGAGAGSEICLGTISNTGKSGAPSFLAQYGLIGAVDQRETLEASVPAAAIQALVSGAAKGLCLYSTDTANWGGRTFSRNYMMLDGRLDPNPPKLTVTFG